MFLRLILIPFILVTLVVLSFEVFLSQFHIQYNWGFGLLGCDTLLLDEGQLFKCLFSGWRPTLLMKWLQWRHAVCHVFHILLFVHILCKHSSNLCCNQDYHYVLTSRLNIYIQADFFRDTTIWDFAINLTMKKIKNISNVLQLMNE